jgi:hypothetical protein
MTTIAPTLPELPERTARTDALAYSNLEAAQRIAYHKAASAAWRNDPKNAASIKASAKRYREGHKAECAAASKLYKARSYNKQADIDRRLDLLTSAQARLGEERALLSLDLDAMRAVAERLRDGHAVGASVDISVML